MVDAVIAVLLLAAAVVGYGKGLIRSLVGLVGNVLALGLAFVLARPVAQATGGALGVEAAIAAKIERLLPLPEGFDEALASTQGTSALYTYLNDMHLPKAWQQSIAQSVQDQVHQLGEGVFMTMSETVSRAVAAYIWQGLVFVLLWLVLGLIIIGGSRLLAGLAHQVPIIGTVDRSLGAAVMLILVALTLAVLYNALAVFAQINAADNALMAAISRSQLLPILQSLLQLALHSKA